MISNSPSTAGHLRVARAVFESETLRKGDVKDGQLAAEGLCSQEGECWGGAVF